MGLRRCVTACDVSVTAGSGLQTEIWHETFVAVERSHWEEDDCLVGRQRSRQLRHRDISWAVTTMSCAWVYSSLESTWPCQPDRRPASPHCHNPAHTRRLLQHADQSPGSTQPSIPPGQSGVGKSSIPACLAGIKAGALTCVGWQVTLCDRGILCGRWRLVYSVALQRVSHTARLFAPLIFSNQG